MILTLSHQMSHAGGRLMGILSLLLAAATGCNPAMGDDAKGAAQKAVPTVVVAAVKTQDVDRSMRFIGNIQAIESVDLIARVEGFLEQVAFKQGSMVEKGQMLYLVEQAPYQASLDNAKGQLAAAQADSASAAAALEDKEGDFKRQSTLLKKGDTSKTAFDQIKAQRDEAKANVLKAKATEQQAAASVATAQINLSYTTISSPIKGRIGATKYTVGNLVNPSSGTLATVVQLDPIRAVFSIPSAEYVKLMGQVGKHDLDDARAQYVPELVLPTGETYTHKGKIAFVDNQVNASTGSVAVYADFPNPGQLLMPGQFVTAVVHQAQRERLPVVPAAAVQRTKDGVQVYVLDKQDRVSARKIQLGPQVGTGYGVTGGLEDGELVIVSGLQKVKPGVVVNPTREPQSTPSATQDDSSGAVGGGN